LFAFLAAVIWWAIIGFNMCLEVSRVHVVIFPFFIFSGSYFYANIWRSWKPDVGNGCALESIM